MAGTRAPTGPGAAQCAGGANRPGERGRGDRCRAAWRLMREASGGVIVNIGSLSGVANVEKFPGLAAYNVSKAGLISLTEAVALEGRPHRIRCVALSPGAVDTEMLRRAAPQLT